MRSIFDTFGEASGLAYNIAKTQMVAIRCDEEQLALARSLFSCQAVKFSIEYLGIPLSTHKLPRLAFQPLIDKMSDKLPTWKGDLMNRSGHLAFINSTLFAMSVHTTLSIDLPPWVIKAMNRIMKAFLWMGTDVVHGGKCVVAWCCVQRPLALGGLGVVDLKLRCQVLQTHWLWLEHTQPDLPWVVNHGKMDATVAAFFRASSRWLLDMGT
jgi:hypothetical protein